MGCSGSSGSRRAFRTRLYSAINPLTDALPYLPGGTTAEAFAINDRSQVVGYSNPRVGTSTVTRPTLWQGSTVSDLSSLGGNSARAFGINRLGQVVGHSYLSDNTTLHAFLWGDGVFRDSTTSCPLALAGC
ncbi:MAG: hypothetical protein ACUVR7_00925 [Armatimonadota bacterium]